MYTCSTDSVSHLRHWCSVKLNKFIIEMHTNKYMTSYCTLVWSAIIICERVRPPGLHMPNTTSRFHLYSDTSKFATESVLYQIQNGKPKLTAYASKRLPEAIRNYSITELELCGLAINIASFSHLLKRIDFDVISDHLSLTYIIKSIP